MENGEKVWKMEESERGKGGETLGFYDRVYDNEGRENGELEREKMEIVASR